jgi:hypothetical protein
MKIVHSPNRSLYVKGDVKIEGDGNDLELMLSWLSRRRVQIIHGDLKNCGNLKNCTALELLDLARLVQLMFNHGNHLIYNPSIRREEIIVLSYVLS